MNPPAKQAEAGGSSCSCTPSVSEWVPNSCLLPIDRMMSVGQRKKQAACAFVHAAEF